MKTYWLIVHRWFLLSCLLLLFGVDDSKSDFLSSPNVTNWGAWGIMQHCPKGTVVTRFQLRTEAWSHLGPFYDDTCLNSIRFYCGNPKEEPISFITSSEGYWGKWGQVFTCNGLGYAIGFMMKSEPEGSTWFDETAANNLRILCAGSTNGFIEGDGERFGDWTAHRICPKSHQYFCGLQTQVQEPQGVFGDNTALNNIKIECCEFTPSQMIQYNRH